MGLRKWLFKRYVQPRVDAVLDSIRLSVTDTFRGEGEKKTYLDMSILQAMQLRMQPLKLHYGDNVVVTVTLARGPRLCPRCDGRGKVEGWR